MKDWQSVLARPREGQHIAQVYMDDGALIDVLAHFVRTGLAQGEGVVVFATPAHWGECVCRFAAEGVSLHEAEGRGQLAVLDARTVLSSFMVDGMPDWKAFQDVVGTVINLTRRKYRRIRAFGELANLLWQRGEHAAALRLEELWNHLVKLHDLALCCAYRIDDLDESSYTDGLKDIISCRHTHLVPSHDCPKLERSVGHATESLLGPHVAAMVRSLAAAHAPPTEMPEAESMLLWMREHMPVTAAKVLSRARGELRPSRMQRTPEEVHA